MFYVTRNFTGKDMRFMTADNERFMWRLRRIMKNSRLIYSVYHALNVCRIKAKSIARTFIYKCFVKFNHDGINRTEKRTIKITASLTSYPARINTVPYAIASILRQTMKPDRIVLWLGKEKFPDEKLPKIFDEIKACGVEIKFREDLKPHTKYFYAMKEYPDDIVITFDDDCMYDRDVIEKLYKSYTEHPECVSGMTVHRLTFKSDGSIAGYFDWEHGYTGKPGNESHTYLAAGVGSVLYPPEALHEEAFNTEAMKKLCPKADDIWLKVMEVMKGTKVVIASSRREIPAYDVYDGNSSVPLGRFNDEGGGNDEQFRALIEEYNTWPLASTGKTLIEMMREDSDGVE